MKSIKDIAWNVTEDEYRKDLAYSYSTLAKFYREGFNNLSKLFDRVDTPSLTFGSAVDSIITGGQEEFNERFFTAEFPSIPDTIIKIVKSLFSLFSESNTSIESISDNDVISIANNYNYQPNWKPETRARVIKEKGSDYYNLLYIAGERTILSSEEYSEVIKTVDILKESNATKEFFKQDNPFDETTERLYQLKFKATFNNIDYRCMSDLLYVRHDIKTIYPIDLKTSSHTEWDFYKSFIDWCYHIQARLYWRIIRSVMDKDSFYKDYKLDDYRFIVANKRTLTPLVWKFPMTQAMGSLFVGKNKQIELKDPFDIGEELHYYLNNNSVVPKNINKDSDNDLRYWLNTL